MLLDMIWSHCRNINVFANKRVIKYCVPIYSEKNQICTLKSIKVKDNDIELIFYKKEEPVIVKDKNKFLDLQ
jgi:hypothetical protein